MYTEKEKIDILEQLGYEVKKYSVDDRMKNSKYTLQIKKHYGYEVFRNSEMVGKLNEVFKQELTKRIFNSTDNLKTSECKTFLADGKTTSVYLSRCRGKCQPDS